MGFFSGPRLNNTGLESRDEDAEEDMSLFALERNYGFYSKNCDLVSFKLSARYSFTLPCPPVIFNVSSRFTPFLTVIYCLFFL
jgi:hypothetical protein